MTQEELAERAVELEAANKELEAFAYSATVFNTAPNRAEHGNNQSP